MAPPIESTSLKATNIWQMSTKLNYWKQYPHFNCLWDFHDIFIVECKPLGINLLNKITKTLVVRLKLSSTESVLFLSRKNDDSGDAYQIFIRLLRRSLFSRQNPRKTLIQVSDVLKSFIFSCEMYCDHRDHSSFITSAMALSCEDHEVN